MLRSMLRRDLRLFLRGLLPALLLAAVLALVCVGGALAAGRGADSLYTPVRVAVVDRGDTPTGRLLIRGVGELDYVAPLLRLEQMEEAAALRALRSGEAAAVILLPEDLMDRVTSAEECRGQILLSSAAASHREVVEAAARCGELLLAAGQCGVFSGESLLTEAGVGGEAYDRFLNDANLALLEAAVSGAGGWFDVTVTDYASTGMTAAGYYGSGWLTLLLFLCALLFTGLCRRDTDPALLRRLRAAGMRSGAFLAGKLLYPTLFRWLLLLPVLLLIPSRMGLSPTVGAVPAALAGAAVAGILSAAMVICLPHGGAVTAGLSMAGLFLCGGIVPHRLLPRWLLTLGGLTPFGAVQGLFLPAFGGPHTLWRWLLPWAYAALALLWLLRRLSALRGGGDRP